MFQLGLMAVAIVAVFAAVLSALTICLISIALVAGIIVLPFAHLLYCACETYYEADFHYWKIGAFVQQQMEGSH